MRIVQVLHDFLPVHQAGSELYTYHLIKELQTRHDVALFCREDGLPSTPSRLRVSEDLTFIEADETYDGIPVRRLYLNSSGAKEPVGGLPPSKRNPGPVERFRGLYGSRSVEQSFDRFLDDTRPDVVHVQHLHRLSGGIIASAKRRGLPVVVTLHDFWYLCHRIQLLRPNLARCSGPARGLKCAGCAELRFPYPWRFVLSPVTAPLFIERTSYLLRHLAMADAILSPSAFVRDIFVRNGFPAGRIEVSDYGTADGWLVEFRQAVGQRQSAAENLDLSPAPSDRSPAAASERRLRFGFVGSVMRHKGVHTLIEAFNQLARPEAELHIFGDPNFDPVYYADMEALARAPHIQFRGKFENTRIAQVLAHIDVLVVPSIWYENSPITIHEARLAGIPVIGSRLGGTPELIQDGVSGFLFRAGDVADLRAKMQRLLDEPGLLAQLREGVRPVKSMQENARELESIYQQLLDRKRCP
jgi:glycosyltransferase involved in cell wall biosynthesis